MHGNHESLRIVQLITKMDTIGGAQVHVRDVCLHLEKEGYSVHLITGGKDHVYETMASIPIHYVRSFVRELHPIADIAAFFEVRRLLNELKPDLVAAHSSKAGIIGRLAAASLNIPVIFTAHGWSFTEGVQNPQRYIYRAIERIVGNISTGVIAVSEYDRNLAIKELVIPERKLICIQNGVNDLVKKGFKSERGDEVNMIMIARFAPPKMQLQLLEVLNDLKHLPWIMTFVGDGPSRAEAEKFANENGLSHKVRFEGWQSEVDRLLVQSDIFILLSEFEGLPLSILEALRAGLPVIATDVGGVKEAVQEENGIVVSKTDSESLKIAIDRLIKDKGLRERLGARGRELYEEKFTFELMMEKTLAYYKTVGVIA